MRTGQILFVLGAALFLTLQVVVFNGYHNEVGLATQQVAKDTQLEQQLALVLEQNSKLRSLYSELETQLSEAEDQVKQVAAVAEREEQAARERAAKANQLIIGELDAEVGHKAAGSQQQQQQQQKQELQQPDHNAYMGSLAEQLQQQQAELVTPETGKPKKQQQPSQLSVLQNQGHAQQATQQPLPEKGDTQTEPNKLNLDRAAEHARQEATALSLAAQPTEFPASNENKPCVGGAIDASGVTAAVVSITFNRPDYLQRHLDSLLQVHGRDGSNRQRFPLYISQDGGHEGVRDMARSYAPLVRYLNHAEDSEPVKRNPKENVAYYRIANHYKFVMMTFFDCFQYPKLVILEDDMELAVDFFSYFTATARLLDADASLYCVSSWNDHGQDRFVRNATQLYRSDFFPGLGWMLAADTWRGFRAEWPDSYWDDWIRLNATRRGRQCIRPEVCRTYNFGEKGSSKGFFYKRFLAPIRLNDLDVDWEATDLSYLEPDRYAAEFETVYSAAPLVASPEVAMTAQGDVRLFYTSQEHYEAITAVFGMLREWKDAVPRAAYKGVVTVYIEQARIFLGPAPGFKAPELTNPSDKPVLVDQNGALLRGRKIGPEDVSS